jgi:rhomboid protease GluP
MASGSRVCPYCGKLNSADDTSCYSCKKRFPGPVARLLGGFWSDFSADGLPGTKLIALICLLVYALLMASDGPLHLDFSMVAGFKRSSLLRFGALYGNLMYFEPFRLLSAVYLHLGLFHIGMNLLGLVGLGREVERYNGTARFLVLYNLAGVVGFVASQWWYERTLGASPTTAGASGALFGLLGAEVGRMWAQRKSGWSRLAVNYLLGALIWNFVMPMNTAAHLGGFVAGGALAALFEQERRRHRLGALASILAVVFMLASVASVALAIRSPVWKYQRELEVRQEVERMRR